LAQKQKQPSGLKVSQPAAAFYVIYGKRVFNFEDGQANIEEEGGKMERRK
jgi:hypothetical protein